MAFQPSSNYATFSTALQASVLNERKQQMSSSLQYRYGHDEIAAYAPSNLQSESNSEQGRKETGVHMASIQTIALSQLGVLSGVTALTVLALLIGGHNVDLNSVNWAGSEKFFSLWDFHLTPTRLVEGVLATLPMVYLSDTVEKSDGRDSHHVNFSTTNMVMTLFGRRKHENGGATGSHEDLQAETPMLDVLFLSACIAMATSVSEEIVFRGIIPSFVAHISHSLPIALFSQAALFGFGHISPKGTSGENRIVAGVQTTNGLWSGLVYLMTGGDILPCIIAHALFDVHVFMKTWMQINDQMDYTEDAVTMRLTPSEQEAVFKIKEEGGPSLGVETLAFARRFFYAFDYEHRGSLSRSDVQRAIAYAFLQDADQPSETRVDELFGKLLKRRDQDVAAEEEQRLELPEFLRMLFVLKASPSAM